MRKSFRTPIQKLPLDKSQKSASKSFVIPPDQTKMETPRTNVSNISITNLLMKGFIKPKPEV